MCGINPLRSIDEAQTVVASRAQHAPDLIRDMVMINMDEVSSQRVKRDLTNSAFAFLTKHNFVVLTLSDAVRSVPV